MRTLAVFLLAAASAFGADDAWTKVKALKSGTEIRIFRKGMTKPLEGKLDEARDDSLVVVLKSEETAIPRDAVDRLDYRPPKQGGRIVSETKTGTDNPNAKPPAGMARGPAVPGTSYSSNVTLGSKPEFETIYRRPPGASKK